MQAFGSHARRPPRRTPQEPINTQGFGSANGLGPPAAVSTFASLDAPGSAPCEYCPAPSWTMLAVLRPTPFPATFRNPVGIPADEPPNVVAWLRRSLARNLLNQNESWSHRPNLDDRVKSRGSGPRIRGDLPFGNPSWSRSLRWYEDPERPEPGRPKKPTEGRARELQLMTATTCLPIVTFNYERSGHLLLQQRSHICSDRASNGSAG